MSKRKQTPRLTGGQVLVQFAVLVVVLVLSSLLARILIAGLGAQ